MDDKKTNIYCYIVKQRYILLFYLFLCLPPALPECLLHCTFSNSGSPNRLHDKQGYDTKIIYIIILSLSRYIGIYIDLLPPSPSENSSEGSLNCNFVKEGREELHQSFI